MNPNSFYIYLRNTAEHPAHINCLQQAKALLDEGHTLNGIFFHDAAVTMARKSSELTKEWLELAAKTNSPLTLCINSNTKFNADVEIQETFKIGSLGDLIELEESSDIYLSDANTENVNLNVKSTNTNDNNKKCLFVFTHAPYQHSFTQAGLDNLFAHASLGRDCKVLLTHGGAQLLDASQDNSSYKNTAKQLSALPLYDIDTVFVCEPPKKELIALPNTQLISIDLAQDMMQNSDFVYYY